jgi:hypothetical protein
MAQTKICKYCNKPIPTDKKGEKYYFYEHYDYDKGKMCKGSEKKK